MHAYHSEFHTDRPKAEHFTLIIIIILNAGLFSYIYEGDFNTNVKDLYYFIYKTWMSFLTDKLLAGSTTVAND